MFLHAILKLNRGTLIFTLPERNVTMLVSILIGGIHSRMKIIPYHVCMRKKATESKERNHAK